MWGCIVRSYLSTLCDLAQSSTLSKFLHECMVSILGTAAFSTSLHCQTMRLPHVPMMLVHKTRHQHSSYYWPDVGRAHQRLSYVVNAVANMLGQIFRKNACDRTGNRIAIVVAFENASNNILGIRISAMHQYEKWRARTKQCNWWNTDNPTT